MSPVQAPVSVVVPAYNAASYLDRTLNSVRGQTLGVDEIVVVDDGSRDATVDIARSHGARVVSLGENRGASTARNVGVRAARNEWIAFLDADDVWKPDKIARHFEVVQRLPDVGLVFTDEEHVRGQTLIRPRFLPSHPPYAKVKKEELWDDVFRVDRHTAGRALFPGNFVKPSTMFLRRSLFEAVGGFDEGFGDPQTRIGTCEDQDLALRLLARTDPVVIEEPLVSYSVHEEGLSSDTIGLKLGYVYLADKVLAVADEYPAGAARYFREMKGTYLWRAAVLCMHEGSMDYAARMLRRSLRHRLTGRALLGLMLTRLGRRTFNALVTLKRKLNLPGLR